MDNMDKVPTITLTLPADFEGGIYCGRDTEGNVVWVLKHKSEGKSLDFPPQDYKYPAKKNS